MEQYQINTLHEVLEDHCKQMGYKVSEVLSFLSVSFVGTMAMHGYSEEFFDATCERMKIQFREKKNGMDQR
jgi:hypothetical protein